MQRNPFRAKAPIPFPGSALRGLAFVLAMVLAAIPTHALWTPSRVSAIRVPDKSIKMDGRPDSVWRAVASYEKIGTSGINFTDYGKMVVLQPEAARNDNPQKFVPSPVNGSATLMAAYDSEALYFFFLIKTKSTIANPSNLGCAATDLWKADAAEIFVDPSQWNPDPETYRSYFTADASGLVFGTSPKSIQLDKPINHPDTTKFFFRNRATADRFQIPAALPAGVTAISSRHSAADPTLRGVEIKIPFWTGAANFTAGKSMFISWGFNLYMDSLWTNCNSNPLGYRWAKNFLNYDAEPEKPPGWHAKDSTHYDPTRSWDGWGKLTLENVQVDAGNCRYPSVPNFNASWSLTEWGQACASQVSTSFRKGPALSLDAAGMPVPSGLRFRDARGRAQPAGSRSPAFPL